MLSCQPQELELEADADTRDDAEMERLLTRFRPGILAVTGAGGLLVVLYLMLFKPSF